MVSEDIAYIQNILEVGWNTLDEDGRGAYANTEEEKMEMLRKKMNEIIYAFKKLEYEVAEEPMI